MLLNTFSTLRNCHFDSLLIIHVIIIYFLYIMKINRYGIEYSLEILSA